MLFIIWTIYVLLGISWLYVFIERYVVQPYDFNMLGSLFIVCFWPAHIGYRVFKKIKKWIY